MDNLKNLKQSMQAQQEKLKEFVTHGDSAIQKFYENSSVFITGGTGFIGKLLIEKLSRACSLNKIYVLIRSKKNKSIKQRILELMDDPVFDVIKSEQPNFGSKIIPIEGDITEYRLGLSKADWNTISDEVDTIFHMAANIRFDVELKEALLCNVRGTREAVQLGKDCKKLRAFVYVSTAYTYATEDRVGCLVSEDIQTPPMESELLVNMAETMSSETLDKIAPVLVNGWPNTYTYTKAVAEEVVRSLGNDLPICVVRPGIVIATYMEPIAGWIDESNVYGPTGLLLGSGLGLVKVLCANRKNKVNIVPGDLVTNAIIAAGWETGSQRETKPLKPEVYTVSNIRNQITWADITNKLRKLKFTLASPKALWYCGVLETSTPLLFWLFTWLFHLVPAYIIDSICYLLGKEKRFVKMYKKIYKLSTLLSYFMLYDWQFGDDNMHKLFQKMSPADQTIFNFDLSSVNWQKMINMWWIGVRKYLIKDDLKGTTKANLKQIIFLVVNYLTLALYLYLIWKIFYYVFFGFSSIFGLLIKIARVI